MKLRLSERVYTKMLLYKQKASSFYFILSENIELFSSPWKAA